MNDHLRGGKYGDKAGREEVNGERMQCGEFEHLLSLPDQKHVFSCSRALHTHIYWFPSAQGSAREKCMHILHIVSDYEKMRRHFETFPIFSREGIFCMRDGRIGFTFDAKTNSFYASCGRARHDCFIWVRPVKNKSDFSISVHVYYNPILEQYKEESKASVWNVH